MDGRLVRGHRYLSKIIDPNQSIFKDGNASRSSDEIERDFLKMSVKPANASYTRAWTSLFGTFLVRHRNVSITMNQFQNSYDRLLVQGPSIQTEPKA